MIIKRVLSAFVFIIILISFSTAVNAESPYTDVSEKFWGYEDVVWVSEGGLMVGTSDGLFSPNSNMTRAMLAAVLWRYEGEPVADPCAFNDVKRDFWYTDSIDWAAENGIVYGMTETTFSPNGNITREQLVTILYRYANTVKIDTSNRADLRGFADSSAISNWAIDAMQWAVAEKLIQGIATEDVLNVSPRGNATRAQVAAILHRFDNLTSCGIVGHKEEVLPELSPTCEDDGLYGGLNCSVCDLILQPQISIPALGHEYHLENIKYPTCVDEGYNYYVCQNDTSHTKTVIVDAEEHIPGEVEEDFTYKTESTCVQKGYTDMVVNCIMCGCELTRERVELPLAEHLPDEVEEDITARVEPYCTVAGSYDMVTYCKLCTEEVSRTTLEIPATGHSYSAVVTEPTCTEKGYTSYSCQNKGCSFVYLDSYVEALGHDEVIDREVSAKCEESGHSEGKHCKRCGEILVEQHPVLATGHDYVGVFTDFPTCTEKGIVTFTCRNDRNHTYIEERDSIGHDYADHEAKLPDCTSVGWYAYRDCTRCDYTTYTEIPAIGHTEEIVFGIAPECEKTGLTDGVKCSVCDVMVVPQKKLPALGHDYQLVHRTDPTCIEEGYEVYCCTHDETHSYTLIFKTTDHSYEVVVIPPTDILQGYTIHTCTECGHCYVDSFVDPLGIGGSNKYGFRWHIAAIFLSAI